MSQTQEEKCRVIAEWLSPNGEHGEGDDWTKLPDFYTSESASALILEKMPAPELYCHPPDHIGPEKGWRCRPDWGLDFAVYHSDRKTAIAEAALRLIELESRKGDK